MSTQSRNVSKTLGTPQTIPTGQQLAACASRVRANSHASFVNENFLPERS